MSKKTLREKILAADDAPLQPVEIPEWGIGKGEVFIKPLDGESRFKIAKLASTAADAKDNTFITEAYVCEALVTEDGEALFNFDERGQLSKKNPVVIDRLFRKICKASKIEGADVDEAEKK